MITTRKFSIPFTIRAQDHGSIDLDGEGQVVYNVACRVDGVEYIENRSQLDLSVGEVTPTVVTVPGYRVEQISNRPQEGPVVFYQLFVKTTNGDEFMLEKRYSEINFIDSLIRSATASHLQGSLPSLPGKVWNPWTDQTSETFIYSRRMALESYFAMLIGNSKVVHYQDTLAFLGLDVLTGLPADRVVVEESVATALAAAPIAAP
jgi:hypothetical protein